MSQQMNHLHPRQVANKSSNESLRQAIKMALAIESDAVRVNTQSFNQNRYQAVAEIEDYENLKDQARTIKEYAIEHIQELIDQLTKVVESRGGHVFFAKTKAEATNYVKTVCEKHRATLVVKAKSMTTEEIKLNVCLEQADIEVAETDLAEFILQYADEQPSHIVAPALHRSRERISQLFKQKFKTNHPLETGEDLTLFARDILRKKFLSADIGISGANCIAADTGTILLVESEGNIRMVTQAPSVHIAIAGVEKIIPKRQQLAVFIELLAASGTGQPLSSYTNIISPPLDIPPFSFDGRTKRQREFHLILIDNGRMKMREDPELIQALFCIRCSACLNVCANFQVVGGHAFGGETYSGGIGGAWEAGTGTLENARFCELCSGCSRCVNQCPVRINIPWLNAVLRNRMQSIDDKKTVAQKQFFANFSHAAKSASRLAPVSNWMSQLPGLSAFLQKRFGIDQRRSLPIIHAKTLAKQYVRWQQNKPESNPNHKVVLFADVYNNYTNPSCGTAALKVLTKLGVDVSITEVMAEGRAALSQGLIPLASERATKTAIYLEKWIEKNNDIIVIEPSVLALFKIDCQQLVQDEKLWKKLIGHAYDPLEYICRLFEEYKIHYWDYFESGTSSTRHLFYHGHCQQKNIRSYQDTLFFFRKLGFDVTTSTVECCGMAGSFGYKKDFYDMSVKVGEDVINQIKTAESKYGEMILLASGISCREQIQSLVNREVFHPIEFTEKIMK